MRLALLGATGPTGRELVGQGLLGGHAVVALARRPAELDDLRADGLEVVRGDARSEEPMARLLEGADAVLSALGPRRGESEALPLIARRLVRAMSGAKVARLVWLTRTAVHDPQDRPRPGHGMALSISRLYGRQILVDTVAAATEVRSSDRDWTLVRAGRLTSGPASGRAQGAHLGLGARSRVSRADVAAFMLAQVGDETWLRRMPVVTVSS